MKLKFIVLFFSLIAFVLSAVLRFPTLNENFLNSDASYHVLLTMTAFRNFTFSDHFFLPLVTLNQYSANINWGATIASDSGIYFYTSFSGLGFLAPYIFFELFNLELTLQNLFIFNTLLMFISLLLILYLLVYVFKINQSKIKYLVIFVIVFSFIFSPEVMHSMGITYWHHSVFLPFFLLQTIF